MCERRSADVGATAELGLETGLECLHGETGLADKAPQRSSCDFSVVGNRQGRRVASLDKDDVATFLAGDFPAELREDADRLPTAHDR